MVAQIVRVVIGCKSAFVLVLIGLWMVAQIVRVVIGLWMVAQIVRVVIGCKSAFVLDISINLQLSGESQCFSQFWNGP